MITTTLTMSLFLPFCFTFIICMLCLAMHLVCAQHQFMCIPRERQALLQFKAALHDPYGMLSSWTNSSDCCRQWHGIRCSNLTHHVLMLDLHGNYFAEGDSQGYISGEIHKSLTELRQLKYLNLSNNYFSDTAIPEFLGSLTNLRYVDLSSGHFGGKIPTQFGSLSHLKYLNLAGNSLDGVIPPQLGNLSNLQHLDLSFNFIEGNIPSQLGNLSNLQHLDLFDNSFEGNIPSQLENLSNLQKLYLGGFSEAFKIDDGNQWLSNLISLTHLGLSSISNLNSSHSWLQMILKLPKLRELRLEECDLSDHFILSSRPYTFNSSTSLSVLELSGNTLMSSSMIFQWVSNITSNLVELDLNDNLLEGSTSNRVGVVMNSLEHLDLSSNGFKGEDLKSFMNICTLHSLSMIENNLTEDLPSILHNLSSGCVSHSLQELDLSINQITGSLPPDLSVFSSLKSLFLDYNQLSGKIPEGTRLPSKLESLSITSNSLEGGVPKSFWSACSLESLDLSYNKLSEELKVISLSTCSSYSLRQLRLRGNKIPGISKLEILDLSGNQLKEIGVPKSFRSANILRSLDLSNNNLSGNLPRIIHHLSRYAGYSLQELDLSFNQITGSLPDLSVFSSLKSLLLDGNQLSGKIPEGTRLPSKLESLSVSSNSIEVGVPKSFGSACSLESLDLSFNNLSEEVTVILNHLSGCSRYSLRQLNLAHNKIPGTLPDFSMLLKLKKLDMRRNQISGTLPNLLSMFPSLKVLHLAENKLNGTISEDVRFPAKLEELDLSSNSLKGVITHFHFASMSKLNTLDLSDNSLTLAFPPNWVPSFQLHNIGLGSCKLGPTFPKWLQTQNDFYYLDISNAGISDTVPKWFWAKLASEKTDVDISFNNLQGVIPNFPLKNHDDISLLYLGSNQFEGPIPPFLRGYNILDLSKNKFSESVSFLCDDRAVETLYQLDLSNNQLSGQIPDCWGHFKSLAYLNLSDNKFSGKIPTSMGSLLEPQVLSMRNNNLTDEVPFSLRNCRELVMLDMAENRLSGPIPAWIGREIQELQILSLGGNHFNGSLPLQICYLKNIQLLDLSLNNLCGRIPKCIKNFTSMAQKTFSTYYQNHSYIVVAGRSYGNWSYDLNAFLTWKGSAQMFMDNELSLLKSIDLSSNQFSEEIPSEIEYLIELVSLNLSRNNLTGKIPSNTGKLTSLEFLDLSRNQLVGSIPWSLTEIDRLTMLDVSHNHLSGEIPTSTQLQSFNATSYEDNLNLCGEPLDKCREEKPQHNPEDDFHNDESLFITDGFYISMALGFIIGFWGSFGSILFKRSWRLAYFKFLNNLRDNIYAMAAH